MILKTAFLRSPSSFSFSGAGFLACYHMGAAKCLLEHGLLPGKGQLLAAPADADAATKSTRLTGVSGGALVAAALCAGVDPVDGMAATLNVSQAARQAGRWDALQPGFSLVDVMEKWLSKLVREAVNDDSEYFMRRIEHGKRLRIGLTDRRVFPPVGNPSAFVYVDQYRSIDDVLAACILSSYIPGVTGPALGSRDRQNSAVWKAAKQLKDMIQAGCVKDSTGLPLTLTSGEDDIREICWDGGLVNNFPLFDDDTVMITPLAADFFPNASINPGIEHQDSASLQSIRKWAINDLVQIHITSANMITLRMIVLSSEDRQLESKYAEGYDNARLFLNQRNLLTVFHSSPAKGPRCDAT